MGSDKQLYAELSPEAVAGHLQAWIRRHALLQGVKRLGLAVSGGADSIALLHLMLPLLRSHGVTPVVLHLDHALREVSRAEADFVMGQAEKLGVVYYTQRLAQGECRVRGLSLEMAARLARMRFFAQGIREHQLDAIATGHQADDVAEGLLLRLARGAGTGGLAGMLPRSARCWSEPAPGEHSGSGPSVRMVLLRPLLTLSADTLRAWLRSEGRSWYEDRSNSDLSIPRNRVRAQLLPQMEQLWQRPLRGALCRSAEILRADDQLLEALAHEKLKPNLAEHRDFYPFCLPGAQSAHGTRFRVGGLLRQPEALGRRMLRQWLFSQGLALDFMTILALLERCREPQPWRYTLPGGQLLNCEHDTLFLELAALPEPEPLVLPVPTILPLRWGGFLIRAHQGHGIIKECGAIATFPAACSLDAASIAGRTLVVRARRSGDSIAPTGMGGRRTLKKILLEAGVPAVLRNQVPLLTLDERVIWVPGYRVARECAVRADDAASLRISVESMAASAGAAQEWP